MYYQKSKTVIFCVYGGNPGHHKTCTKQRNAYSEISAVDHLKYLSVFSIFLLMALTDEQIGNVIITIDEQLCGRIGKAPGLGESHTVVCEKPLTGKTLKIQKEKEELLNLAEVEPIIAIPNGC